MPRRKELELLSERRMGIINAEIPKWLLQGRKLYLLCACDGSDKKLWASISTRKIEGGH